MQMNMSYISVWAVQMNMSYISVCNVLYLVLVLSLRTDFFVRTLRDGSSGLAG